MRVIYALVISSASTASNACVHFLHSPARFPSVRNLFHNRRCRDLFVFHNDLICWAELKWKNVQCGRFVQEKISTNKQTHTHTIRLAPTTSSLFIAISRAPDKPVSQFRRQKYGCDVRGFCRERRIKALQRLCAISRI